MFKVGDSIRRVQSDHPFDEFHKIGTIHTVPSTAHNYGWSVGAKSYNFHNYELVKAANPTVPVFDVYIVCQGVHAVAEYTTFEEAETRAKGLAEGNSRHMITIKGRNNAVLIAAVECPPSCAVTTFV